MISHFNSKWCVVDVEEMKLFYAPVDDESAALLVESIVDAVFSAGGQRT